MSKIEARPAAETGWHTLVLAVQTRLLRGPDGVIRAAHGYARYEAWCDYLAGVPDLVLVARVEDTVTVSGHIVEGPGVRVEVLTPYRGPLGLLRSFPSIWRVLGRVLSESTQPALAGARVPDLLGAVLQLKARFSRVPFFTQVVGDVEAVLASGSTGKRLKRLSRLAGASARLQVRAADGSIYVTQHALQLKYPASNGKVTAVRSNVERASLVTLSHPRTYADLDDSSFTAITAGSQEQQYKGHDVLIEAVALLWKSGYPVRTVIIGDGQQHKSLVALAEARGVSDLVRFMGQLPHAEAVMAEVRRADVFVLPSRTEGLSRVLIEAMSTGIACVGSRVGGTPELLTEDAMFMSDSPEGLAAKLNELRVSPDKLAYLARRQHHTIQNLREKFTGSEPLEVFFLELWKSSRS